jgi:hypothetical protein
MQVKVNPVRKTIKVFNDEGKEITGYEKVVFTVEEKIGNISAFDRHKTSLTIFFSGLPVIFRNVDYKYDHE